ncbi:hypothetical protein [Blastococcus tunisiensis]|uniref:Uncharacterized protein n=1 Tax=Blastococcus tunisiensis TaxID=1798228 RepID=A0A1I1Y573_9ACTN|nr:hypothetical protein [Blastococcus sp. DSM 46838]SFE14128.1 hypothetical protein SAMN05216574_102250 [Blastococcus sp. DSM 46838]
MLPAADDPATRTALAAHQAGALRWLGGGVIAVVLGVLLGAAGSTLVDDGRTVPGLGLAVIVLVLVGLVGVVAGAGALLRTVRWQRALATTPWRTGRLRIAGPAVIAFEPEGFDELDPTAEPVRLQLLSTAVWRTRAVQGLDGGEVRAAPVGNGQWVLGADGLPTLYGAKAARR